MKDIRDEIRDFYFRPNICEEFPLNNPGKCPFSQDDILCSECYAGVEIYADGKCEGHTCGLSSIAAALHKVARKLDNTVDSIMFDKL